MAPPSSIIALIDMDCFYVQVHQKTQPELRGKPVVVVQYRDYRKGGIIAIGYEARAFGIKRGMFGADAEKLCPDVVLCKVPASRGKANLTIYRDASKDVFAVLNSFDGVTVERASIDEAYLDLTELVDRTIEQHTGLDGFTSGGSWMDPEKHASTFVVGNGGDNVPFTDWMSGALVGSEAPPEVNTRLVVAAQIVNDIRSQVFEKTGFHCSAGISHNKTLAKLVCGINKPRKQTLLPYGSVLKFFGGIKIGKVRGLGGKLGHLVQESFGIETMSQLATISCQQLVTAFGDKTGRWLFEVARGDDKEPVKAKDLPKSIGCGRNFNGREALSTVKKVKFWLRELSSELVERLDADRLANKRCAKSLSVSLKNSSGTFSRAVEISKCDVDHVVADVLKALLEFNETAGPGASSTLADATSWTPPLNNVSLAAGKFEDDEAVKSKSLTSFYAHASRSDHLAATFADSDDKRTGTSVDDKPSMSAAEGRTSSVLKSLPSGKVDDDDGVKSKSLKMFYAQASRSDHLNATFADSGDDKWRASTSTTEKRRSSIVKFCTSTDNARGDGAGFVPGYLDESVVDRPGSTSGGQRSTNKPNNVRRLIAPAASDIGFVNCKSPWNQGKVHHSSNDAAGGRITAFVDSTSDENKRGIERSPVPGGYFRKLRCIIDLWNNDDNSQIQRDAQSVLDSMVSCVVGGNPDRNEMSCDEIARPKCQQRMGLGSSFGDRALDDERCMDVDHSVGTLYSSSTSFHDSCSPRNTRNGSYKMPRRFLPAPHHSTAAFETLRTEVGSDVVLLSSRLTNRWLRLKPWLQNLEAKENIPVTTLVTKNKGNGSNEFVFADAGLISLMLSTRKSPSGLDSVGQKLADRRAETLPSSSTSFHGSPRNTPNRSRKRRRPAFKPSHEPSAALKTWLQNLEAKENTPVTTQVKKNKRNGSNEFSLADAGLTSQMLSTRKSPSGLDSVGQKLADRRSQEDVQHLANEDGGGSNRNSNSWGTNGSGTRSAVSVEHNPSSSKLSAGASKRAASVVVEPSCLSSDLIPSSLDGISKEQLAEYPPEIQMELRQHYFMMERQAKCDSAGPSGGDTGSEKGGRGRRKTKPKDKGRKTTTDAGVTPQDTLPLAVYFAT